MKRVGTGLICLAMLAASRPGTAAPSSLLASAPVDTTMFRDGEVQRTTTPFGRWTLDCDVIARLSHKFCSLRAAPVQFGSATAELLISTGDDGRPAALLRMPFGLSLPFGVRVEPLGSGHKQSRRVPVAVCGGTGCEAVWTLSAEEITALRTGGGLHLAVRGWRFASAPAPFTAVVAPDGFAAAVTASLQ